MSPVGVLPARLRAGRSVHPACLRAAPDQARTRQAAPDGKEVLWRFPVFLQDLQSLEVSDAGVLRTRGATGFELVPRYNASGGCRAIVGGRSLSVPRLIATTFHGQPSPGAIAYHTNRERLDDHASNLHWGRTAKRGRKACTRTAGALAAPAAALDA